MSFFRAPGRSAAISLAASCSPNPSANVTRQSITRSWRFSMSPCPRSLSCAGRALDLWANKASGSVEERWLSSHAHRCRDDKLVSRLATFTPISDGSLLGPSGSGGNAVNQRRGPLRTPCAAGLRHSCQPSGARRIERLRWLDQGFAPGRSPFTGAQSQTTTNNKHPNQCQG